jgi:hypothetical protein
VDADTAGDHWSNCTHHLGLQVPLPPSPILAVARVPSGFGMIALVSGLRMGVGSFAGPVGGVGVEAMPDAELDTTRRFHSVC